MADYDLYYWPLPFRGQFVRAVLTHAGKSWREHDPEAIDALMHRPAGDMPIPFMGPPLLIDRAAEVAMAEMPAIVWYLGETCDLLPAAPAMRALTLKIVCDANDVIDEITLDGGRQMWTLERWSKFEPRLGRWMTFWEETGRRHGLTPEAGFLLGEAGPGVADVVTWTLWSTLTDRFSRIGTQLAETAPRVAGLCDRLGADADLAALSRRAREDYGDAYCGGRIEASLRKVLGD